MQIARRRFTAADQRSFAALSGDSNPVHLDPIAARRTLIGEPVVHGMHGVMWAIEQLAVQGLLTQPVRQIAAQFRQFIPLEKEIELNSVPASDGIRSSITVDGMTATTLSLKTETPSNPPADVPGFAPSQVSQPLDLRLRDIEGLSGCLEIMPLDGTFPAASARLDADVMAELMTLTKLVGMVCPGLHSIFMSFSVALVPRRQTRGLAFRVAIADPRGQLVRMDVQGSAIAGTVTAVVRPSPVEQASMKRIADVVNPVEFAGSTALIVGGSRGLGALTAKILAAGGAKVIVTYALGRDDAEGLSSGINSYLGAPACSVAAFDATRAAGPQLAAIEPVTQFYHFASPRIFGAQRAFISGADYMKFVTFYVTSFADICAVLCAQGTPVTAFYPSSVFAALDYQRPAGMTEYAMAKASGEVLCGSLSDMHPGLRVVCRRLPRLPTDQTASVMPVETADALDTLLPMIRETQGGQ